MRSLARKAIGLLLASLAVASLPATDIEPFTWHGGGGSASLLDSTNWLNGAPPSGTGLSDDVTFGDFTSSPQSPSIGASLTLHSLSFTGGNRSSYTFVSTNAPTLSLLGDVTVAAGGDVTFASSLAISLGEGTHTANIATDTTLSVLGTISGAGGIVKTGVGTLLLGEEPGGINTFSGGLQVQEGRLILGRSSFGAFGDSGYQSPVGSGTLALYGGATLTVAATESDAEKDGILLANPLSLLTDGSDAINHVTVDTTATDLILSGSIAGIKQLVKTGGRQLTLSSGESTFDAGLKVESGALAVGASSTANDGLQKGPVGTGTLTLIIGTKLTIGSGPCSVTLHNPIELAASGGETFAYSVESVTLDTASGRRLELLGGISDNTGSAPVFKTGTGTLALGGAENGYFSGGLTVHEGTLELLESSLTGEVLRGPVGSSDLTLRDSTKLTPGFEKTIVLHNNLKLTGTVGLGSSNGTLSLEGILSDGASAGSIDVDGEVALTETNTFSGSVTLTSGALSISHDGALGTPPADPISGQLTFDGGTLRTKDSFPLDPKRSITLSGGGGTIQTDPDTTLTYGGVITGTGGLTKTGSGIISLTGTNTFTGSTTINGGTLVINGSDALKSNTISVSGTSQLKATFAGIGGTAANALLHLQAYGGVSPGSGDSVGPLTVGSATFEGGSFLEFKINSVTGKPGEQWGLLKVTGALTFSGTITQGNPVTISLKGVDGLDEAHVDTSTTLQWQIIEAGSVTGFNATVFSFDGASQAQSVGRFFVSLDDSRPGSVFLNFTPVPEPSTWALLLTGLAVTGLVALRRRR